MTTEIHAALSDPRWSPRVVGVLAGDATTLRSRRIDSSLRATFADLEIRVSGGHAAPPVCAALIEFDATDCLVFATREAQDVLGFALEPLWGQALSLVVQRVPLPIRCIEWLFPAPQPISSTTRALGSVYAWLRLLAGETDALTICLRNKPSS